MGLDMYLRAELYASKYISKEYLGALKPIADRLGMPDCGNVGSIELRTEAAYWRKANQIHRWFVENVQGGTDDCREYSVGAEQLTELRDLCSNLLSRKDPEEAMQKLPPQAGFFFGSTDIDEWYWSDLVDTVRQLSPLLDNPLRDKLSFHYSSSW